MPPLTRDLDHYTALDKRLVEAARHIKVLSSLGWPARVYDEFMAGYERGQPTLPVIQYPVTDLSAHRSALQAIVKECDVQHPIGRYIAQTAHSYVLAARMLECVGTREFRQVSEALYGKPKDKLGKLSSLKLADDFIRATDDFAAAMEGGDEELACLRPEVVAEELKKKADQFFKNHEIKVVVDPALASKAAAGSERLRIRGSTSFSESEVEQLLEHELLVHSATMLNGRAQPHLKSMGLGAPRTTGTQEGLATFAELITDTMDLSRLRRIALRIKAIQVGLDGGDFIEVFRFFRDAGQSDKESFQSAARIFRGGAVQGKHVFTKDVVYLKGLVAVNTFLRKAIEARKIDYPRHLFIGRVALGDIVSLEGFITSGFIRPAPYQPRWVANRDRLAAYLTYSVFAGKLDLKAVKLSDFIEDLSLNAEGPADAAIA